MHLIKRLALLPLLFLAACDRAATTPSTSISLADARRAFHTHIVHPCQATDPVPTPPRGTFSLVSYDSPVGPLPAYLALPPADDQKHPAIVWITGGDCNSIGDVWSPQPLRNDQSAAAYRKAGIVMLFPALRGGNRNRTSQEHFYGEVDDVLAAADFLATQLAVDPQRIYLGGHSTGGTLALLTAEYSPRFRAVFSFGPVDNIAGYGDMFPIPFDTTDKDEFRLRNPVNWLSFIQSLTFVLEGENHPSNIGCLRTLAAKCPQNVPAHFLPVPNHTHFSDLAPVNALIAQKILNDTTPTCNITIAPSDLQAN